ncbi:hypothetical protein [Blastococcus sp. Marseille-P5729]|uniref:hypothetical protein n=1 Tax=Blastococcus sp. Marseille-P5729 TaxID=2086582 RepID=UPI000D0F3EEC|nr:hypothetical protein [Blastococcus sp. Marseille-P5729]
MSSPTGGWPGGGADDASARGITRVSPHVVERIAAFACHRADRAVTPRTHEHAPSSVIPRARADINGRHARLAVSVGALYPISMTTFARSVRQVVTDDVERLCGLQVVAVDVEAQPVNLERQARVR